jgi:hypothetical protein
MDDRLDIWIGRLLDGEISPKERCLLENEFERDRQARELFEQMRVLHECSCGVVTHAILEQGSDPAAIFERAWQQSKRSFWRRVARGGLEREGTPRETWAQRRGRLAVGIAAGFLLGLLLNLLPIPRAHIPSAAPSGPLVARDVPSGREDGVPNTMVRAWDRPSNATLRVGSAEPELMEMEILPASQPQDPSRNTVEVDWYIFTDRAGNQWLLEGTYEGAVNPTAPADDL